MGKSHSEPEDGEYGLVEPFVVCASVGGPYHDTAFVAGVTYGKVQADMAKGDEKIMVWVPQVDLGAMRFGYSLTVQPYDDDWSEVTLVKKPQPTLRLV